MTRKRNLLSPLAIVILATMTMLTACTNDDPRFSTNHACNFVFRGDYHPASALLRTMDNPGLYALVTSTAKNGITHLTISLNDGATTESIALTTQVEQYYNYAAMGVNRRLIIGCSNFEGPKAWDGHCRYCVETKHLYDAPLVFSNNGRSVTCTKCEREYTLEIGSSTDGQRLFEYRVRFDGTVITVNNQ